LVVSISVFGIAPLSLDNGLLLLVRHRLKPTPNPQGSCAVEDSNNYRHH
jgi:hypothetical protein